METRAVFEFARKAVVKTLKVRLLGFLQIDFREETPQRDTGSTYPRVPELAKPAREQRQCTPWNAVGQREIDVLLLQQSSNAGS